MPPSGLRLSWTPVLRLSVPGCGMPERVIPVTSRSGGGGVRCPYSTRAAARTGVAIMNRKIALSPRDPVPLAPEDIYRGMQEVGSYLDITMQDFRELYEHAYRIARDRILSSVTAGDIMRSPALCVHEEDSVRDVVRFLDEHRISGAPVVDAENRIAGIVSESDIVGLVGDDGAVTAMHLLHLLLQQGTCSVARLDAAVGTILTRDCITAAAETPLGELLGLLQRHGINRLPILNADRQPVGLVSRTDIINAFGVAS